MKNNEDKKKDLSLETVHKPVLLQEVINGLDLKNNQVVFDGTLGGGGYSEEIIKHISPGGTLIATDLDLNAINRSKKRLDKYNIKKYFFQKNYSEIEEILKELNIDKIDRMVMDLGISSDQLSNSGRGISFQNLEESLDMNLNTNKTKNIFTASEILNTWSEDSLADIFFFYGGERASKKVSSAIVKRRLEGKFKVVKDLVDLIEKEIGYFYKNKKIHPATKIFQALRITVNNEIGNLEKTLEISSKILKKGGILAVVTFHSLEDKIVKRIFRKFEDENIGKRINKKVIKPTEIELGDNPRARSAKLRLLII